MVPSSLATGGSLSRRCRSFPLCVLQSRSSQILFGPSARVFSCFDHSLSSAIDPIRATLFPGDNIDLEIAESVKQGFYSCCVDNNV
ncbi:isocitrate dehydrogenase [NAD] catalytic subunit 6, mitochondrial-like [Diospyros lotus]|uniref:isocitrate dehydrogenase [NAD] catalytic subunit 6, mitochondrial-like n=1 Tax=Diospyros lotus TaxID=55363 RepID=UPI0022589918|nr:isocitrate dehydrogenase [NAD] catalytic subunit 6, mitochondrial-like [Diospyros lotus]